MLNGCVLCTGVHCLVFRGEMTSIVVVGSGLAGYGVLRELRKRAPEATLTLVCEDGGDFYSKPMLSTALAKGKAAAQLVTMPAAAMTSQLRLDLRARTRVQAIRPMDRVLQSSAGEIAYDALVLALGAEPVRLQLEGDAAQEVLTVNHLEDYAVFRERLGDARRVLVIGAGLVGAEFANDLSAAGVNVTVVDPLDRPLPALVPPEVGRGLQDALSRQGVAWRFCASVRAVDRPGAGLKVTLSDGETVETDIVLSAVGLRPRTALASAAGLEVGRGIRTDAAGRTSDPHIFAIGDCAEYPVGTVQYITPLMSVARSIAASALGDAAAIVFPVLSVIVKTTAYPVALLPPPAGARGEWYELERDAEGLAMGFRTAEDELAGYVLTQAKCQKRADMDRRVAERRASA